MIPLFDLHCDTLLELYKQNKNIKNNDLHISLEKTSSFSPYVQICAIWSDASLSNDEAFEVYKNVVNYSKNQLQFSINLKNTTDKCFILAVEDARILNGNLERLDSLFNDNVRILTLNWKENTVIGGGWDTDSHLTDFGKKTVKKCFEIGIIPDISHSSINTANDVFYLAEQFKKPVIASHSNSYSVCDHKRNINDEQFNWLVKNNSILGISLASEHLSKNNQATIKNILDHIEHFLNLDGENTICLGCDFDGVSSLPQKICSINDLTLLYGEIIKRFGKIIAQKIFFKNAYNFMSKNLK